METDGASDSSYHLYRTVFNIQRYYYFLPTLTASGRVPQDPQSNFFVTVKTMPYLLFVEAFHNELIPIYGDTLRFKHNLVFMCIKINFFNNLL